MIEGYKSLIRKVYNRFPDMVGDETLLQNRWLIADRGKQYWQEFIVELQQEPPNNLPEDTPDWRNRITDSPYVHTMTWVATGQPKEDIDSLNNYLFPVQFLPIIQNYFHYFFPFYV